MENMRGKLLHYFWGDKRPWIMATKSLFWNRIQIITYFIFIAINSILTIGTSV